MSRRSSTTSRPTPTRSTSISCSNRRTGASIAAATGSTPPATPTRTASTSTTTARSGPIATGSSTPSTRISRSTSSRSSNSPAICCRTARSTSKSPPASTAATSPPTKAALIDEEYLVLYTRDRTETTSPSLAGPDRRLRRLPRSQVRSASAKGVLLAGGVLQQHDARRDGRQHQEHAADHLRAAAGRSPALGRAREGDRRSREGKLEAPQGGRPQRFRQVARDAKRRQRRRRRSRRRICVSTRR